METLMDIFVIFTLSVIITWWIFGPVFSNCKKPSDSLCVKEYSCYTEDSDEYPTTKIYQGIITNKHISNSFVGIIGRGGHIQTRYRTTVSYNNEQHTFTTSDIYYKYKEGNKVKIRVTYYPYYSVDIVN